MEPRKAIDAVMVGNVNSFKKHVETELDARVTNALHQMKLAISVDSLQVTPEADSSE